MSEHTDGPWQVGTRRDGSRWLSIGNPSRGRHYQGDLVCSDADARLIAAAPDLLEALVKAQRYVGMVRTSDIAGDDPIFGVMDEINAAIAKAEGQK